jgi:5-methyltetrahydropteroyltriglutamate--homocysteine methyltransferase
LFAPLAGSSAVAIVLLAVAAAGVFGAMTVFWAIPPTYLTGGAAAGGIAFISSCGATGGFVGPTLIGWFAAQTGSIYTGVGLMGGIMIVGALVLGMRGGPTQMKQHPNRILTTHVGSLPRPHGLLDELKQHLADPSRSDGQLSERIRTAVVDIVRQQADSGIDIVSDGEQGKAGFFSYIRDRLAGFEARPDLRRTAFEAEKNSFPEYYAEYFQQAMMGGAVAPAVPLLCVGPVSYRGRDALAGDIANLQSALSGVAHRDAFIPAVAPAGVGQNGYYKTQEEYLFAVAEALHEEYRTIVDAGFLLQVDDPFLADIYGDPSLSDKERQAAAALNVEAVNHALRGIPPERVRFHTCYGINEGPRIHDAPLLDIVGAMLAVNAGAYSFEAANARHEHEYHV